MWILLLKNTVEQESSEGDGGAHPEDEQIHVPRALHKVVEQEGADSGDQEQDLKLRNHPGPRRQPQATEHKPPLGPHDLQEMHDISP